MNYREMDRSILNLTLGNQDAEWLLRQLLEKIGEDSFSAFLQGLRVLNLRGNRIFVAYNEVAGKEMHRFVGLVRARDQSLLPFCEETSVKP